MEEEAREKEKKGDREKAMTIPKRVEELEENRRQQQLKASQSPVSVSTKTKI